MTRGRASRRTGVPRRGGLRRDQRLGWIEWNARGSRATRRLSISRRRREFVYTPVPDVHGALKGARCKEQNVACNEIKKKRCAE